MWIWLAFMVPACAAGFVLFRRNTIPQSASRSSETSRLSVVIPARNEEENLPHLLSSLRAQRYRPYEIIVVDDGSADRTGPIAREFGATLVEGLPLPEGWTGKNWAVWNGYLRATGDLIAFLDADVRLAPDALGALVEARSRTNGVVSVVPYHYTEKLYERLALVPNLLGLFAFTSPFERANAQKGLYGSCILTSRADYELAKGHEGVKGELLDDLTLGARFAEAGVPVTNFIGRGLVTFRMYPGGIRSEVEGFGKGAVQSTGKLAKPTVLLIALWLVGLIGAEAAPFVLHTAVAPAWAAGYLLYTLQIYYFSRHTGRFGLWLPALHPISTAFFLYIMLYSSYRVLIVGHVPWKGRKIRVRGDSK
ncbi:glycosyltransferase [Cohnella ginsengisoli]|uniref:4,4'-diaponeurosporenoate glycosyltransferase n=1 Tax=Cohnella ginsengisoli TaxID=425004 RepID=A0A9X4QPQ6_9BACL|nr:glycosyltransferase [Cohnella ginsengisoli]MDG0792935.1 glycosyltransferase [Cohnella ginsengisoli]